MVTQGKPPVDPEKGGVLFYLFFDDIEDVHAQLDTAGLDVGTLEFPFYCPEGEFKLQDPDGYGLMLTHT